MNFGDYRIGVKIAAAVLVMGGIYGAYVAVASNSAPVPDPPGLPSVSLSFPLSTITTTTLDASSTTTGPATTTRVTQCSDGIDNDRDGRVDLQDPGCRSASDNSEFTAAATTRATTTTLAPTTTTLAPTTTTRALSTTTRALSTTTRAPTTTRCVPRTYPLPTRVC
ncbi:MAG: hypothetical protein ACT4OM_11425 [Actinomycetota bacterium]